MKWRERWDLDNIADWKTPQPLVDFSPHGVSGYDKEGSPSNTIIFLNPQLRCISHMRMCILNTHFFTVIVVPFAGMDMWGMLHTVSRADFIRSTIKTLEKYACIGYNQSATHGPQARQFVVLFDMAGFNVKQYTWRPGNAHEHWRER